MAYVLKKVYKITVPDSEDDVIAKTTKCGSLIRNNCNTKTCEQSSFAALILTRLQHPSRTECEYGGKKHKKGICDSTSKGRFCYILEGGKPVLPALWSAAIGVVSVENSPCFIILMAVSNCIMSEQQVAPAAEVAAPTASPPLDKGFRPRLTGQGLVRTQAWLSGQWV